MIRQLKYDPTLIEVAIERCKTEHIPDLAKDLGLPVQIVYNHLGAARKRARKIAEKTELGECDFDTLIDRLKSKLTEADAKREAMNSQLGQLESMAGYISMIKEINEEITFLQRAVEYFTKHT